MAKVSFIHLSDIHFVKESGKQGDIDNDLRKAILTDIELNAKETLGRIEAVLISGDIAYSGNEKEYDIAAEFLKEITDIFKMSKSSVYCVPGNHDVNQDVAKESHVIYQIQCALDNASSLDNADKIFEKNIYDKYFSDLLFKPIEEYNNFASKFGCETDSNKFYWVHQFNLDYGMKLSIQGINSCLISNADDHKVKLGEVRRMYVGQAQIPFRDRDTVNMILCHHPPECWKFYDDFGEKFNRRADIQLYGHKHTQSIELTEENVTICSGATHPTRGDDWNPRYNWITLECIKIGEKRVIKIELFPRILDKFRDRFIPEKDAIEHCLHIDKKREEHLIDNPNSIPLIRTDHQEVSEQKDSEYDKSFNYGDLIYDFFDLTKFKQTKILNELNLLDEKDWGKPYTRIINDVIEKAAQNNLLRDFTLKIMEGEKKDA
jgi:predicted phosphodiesterase